MPIRTLLKTSVMVAALVTTSALFTEALAQKGGIVSPASAWAVTKIDHADGPYCALARRYEQDAVLTFAKNEKAEMSFALDFHRPLFNTKGTMPVTLDPGAGEQRRYDLQPISARAFVVHMGADAPFFTALQKTGLLRIESGAQSYNFNVSDIDSGQEELSACVAQMALPAAGGEAVDGGGSVESASETESYRQEINTLRRQLTALQTTHDALKKQTESMAEAVPVGAPAPAPDVKGAEPVPDLKAVELAEQLKTVQGENESLKARLQRLNVEGGRVETLQATVDSLNAEKQALEKTAQEKEALAGQARAVQARVAALQTQVQGLEQKLAQAEALQASMVPAKMSVALADDLSRLKAENIALKSDLEKARVSQAEIAENKAIQSRFKNENDTLRSEIVALKSQTQKTSVAYETVATLEKTVETLKSEKLALEHLLQSKPDDTARVAALEAQIQALEGKLAEKGRSADDVAALEKAVSSLSAENERYKAQGEADALKRVAVDSAELKDAQAQVTTLETQLSALRQDHETLQRAFAEAKTATKPAPAVMAEHVTHHELEVLPQEQTPEPVETQEEKTEPVVAESAPLVPPVSVPRSAAKPLIAEDIVQAVAPHARPAPVSGPVKSVPAAVALRRTQDPFEGMAVETEEGRVLQRAVDDVPVEGPLSSSQQMERREKAVLAEEAPETARLNEEALSVMRGAAPPLEDVPKARTAQVSAPADAKPPAQEALKPVEKQPETAGYYTPAHPLPEMFSQARLMPSSALQRVDSASGPAQVSYQWKGGAIFGTAEQKPLSSPAQFDGMVKDYLERTQSRCQGEFAIVPDDSTDQGGVRADSYEIACVGQNVSAGASLLFFNQGGTFTVVAHEAPTDGLDEAMARRDEVLQAVMASAG